MCGNSDEQIINSQTKTNKLVSLHKRGINMYFCTEPLITTTFIGQPIVIACPQQAWNNHYIVGEGGGRQVGGETGGREPGRTVGERGTETEEVRAGSGISTMAGSGTEIQKGKLSLFLTAYIQSKKRTQQRSLTSI